MSDELSSTYSVIKFPFLEINITIIVVVIFQNVPSPLRTHREREVA